MHKVAAEIIAGVIPIKMTRNRWRGLLRFGPLNAVRLLYELWRDKTVPGTYLAVCAIAKDEGQYFKEWLDWHIDKGVDRFFIYDNGSTDETRAVLEPYIQKGIVEYVDFPGYRVQLAAYDDCLKRHRFDTRWIAFIDLDEFLVPMRDKSLPDFLRRFHDFCAVEINWLVYGSGNQKTHEPGGVMERFVRHSLPSHRLNRQVKSIVNPRRVFNMIGCHEASRISGKSADSHGNKILINCKEREPLHDVIRINHYAVKSLEEFHEKCAKGRASGPKRFIDMNYFNKFDLNDVTDNQVVADTQHAAEKHRVAVRHHVADNQNEQAQCQEGAGYSIHDFIPSCN